MKQSKNQKETADIYLERERSIKLLRLDLDALDKYYDVS